MSAPLSGTRTRVVGFIKGLFGKGNSDSATVQPEVVSYYNQEYPITGANMKAPAPSAMPAAKETKSGAAPGTRKYDHDHGHSASAPAPVAQPVARHSANINGFTISGQSSGHINGVVLQQNGEPPVARATASTKVASVVPAPAPVKPTSGNGLEARVVAPTPKPLAKPPGKCVELPIEAVVAVLPADLQSRVIKKDFAKRCVTVALETIFPQLASGVVKVPFGIIRESAPHLFAPATDADQTMITLPLGEVLRQISPAQFAKPDNQVRITADEDVTSPFADKGNNPNLEVKKDSAPTRSIVPEPTAPAPTRQSLSEVPRPSAPAANATPSMRINVPVTPPPASKPPTPPAPAARVTPPTTPAPIAMPKVQPPTPNPAPANGVSAAPKAPTSPTAPIPLPKAHAPAPIPAPAPVAPPTPKINGVPSLSMCPATDVPAPVASPVSSPAPAPTAKPTTSQATLTVSLKSLVDTWPEAVKKEVLDHNLLNGSVDLPLDTVATQLKNGRVAFPWNQIRSWISPRPDAESPNGAVELELPLKVMAPLFLGLKSTDSTKSHRLTADQCIPDVFAPASKPVAPATLAHALPASAVEPTPTPVAAPAAMTPDAVVKRAAALQGVAGALVALPDGLVVASKLPAGLSADSLAAFLPQIYAKFDACLKDLSMDGLNNLNFTAGNVPWRVYRTSSIYFAAFGRANEPLPADWLTTLAAELEKKQG